MTVEPKPQPEGAAQSTAAARQLTPIDSSGSYAPLFGAHASNSPAPNQWRRRIRMQYGSLAMVSRKEGPTPIATFGSEYLLEPVAYGLKFAGAFSGGMLLKTEFSTKLQDAGVNATAYAAKLHGGRTMRPSPPRRAGSWRGLGLAQRLRLRHQDHYDRHNEITQSDSQVLPTSIGRRRYKTGG